MSNTVKLPADLQDLLNTTAVFSDTKRQTLAKANKDLFNDPSFKADLLKSSFVEDIYSAMEEKSLSKSALAKMWGKTRQYIAKILDEDAKINFTIETMVEISHHCGLELKITTSSKDEHIWKNFNKAVNSSVLNFWGVSPCETNVESPDDIIIPLFRKQDWQKEKLPRTPVNNDLCLSA
jgi:ribosome-binding protein aMBF1 (putative translation factor)